MFIYVIRHTASGREYIGKTVRSLRQRLSQHKWNAKHGIPTALHMAMAAEGVEAFEMSLLAVASSHEELDRLERQIILERGTRVPNGYNLNAGGQRGPTGRVVTAEARAKQSSTMTGRPSLNKGTKWSAEARAIHMAVRQGKPGTRKGVRMSAETKAKLSAAHKGKSRTPAQNEALARLQTSESRRHWWATRTPEQLEQIRLQRSRTSRQVWMSRRRPTAA